MQGTYIIGGWITGILTFIGSWIFCIVKYGYLLGVGLGWLPSIIVGVIAGLLWPLIATILVIGAMLLWNRVA